MLKLLILLIISTTIIAKDKKYNSQIHYLNAKSVASVEIYSNQYKDESRVNIPTDVYKSESTNIGLTAQYGLLGQLLNIGLNQEKVTKTDSGNREGLRDTVLFIKGKFRFLLYGYDYSISHDDLKSSNSYSGGNHFSYTLGLTAYNFGLTRIHSEDYKFKDADDDVTYKTRDRYQYKLFYDCNLNFLTVSPFYQIVEHDSKSTPSPDYKGYGLKMTLHIKRNYDLYGEFEKFERDDNTQNNQKYTFSNFKVGLRARF